MKLLLLFFVFLFLQTASAQEADVISSQVETARQVYLAKIDDARVEVIAVLDKKIRDAQQSGVLETVERLTTEKEEFTKDGTTPSSIKMRTFNRKVSTALLTLKREFKVVIKRLVQQGKIEEAKHLRDELKTFEDSPLNRSNWGIADYKIQSGAGAWQPFSNRVRAFTNRVYVWNDISPSWPLKQFAPVAGGKQVPIQIDVSSPGWVFIAFSTGDKASVATYLTDHSWQPTPYTFSYNAHGKTTMRIFRKQLSVGEYAIPRINFSGPVLLKP